MVPNHICYSCLWIVLVVFTHALASLRFNRTPYVVLHQWFSNCGTRTTSGTRGLVRWYASSFPVYSKSFVNSFLCYNSFVCYPNVANSFMCYSNLKYIWANYVLLKPGVYTPTLKKHQVVRDLKKFENHYLTRFVSLLTLTNDVRSLNYHYLSTLHIILPERALPATLFALAKRRVDSSIP